MILFSLISLITKIDVDWVAISALATFFMAVATFVTLYQNKKQLKELKRQWQYEHSAQLDFCIEIQSFIFCLKMQNIGKSAAKIKQIHINNDFLEVMPQKNRVHLETGLCSNPLIIAPNMMKYYLLIIANIEEITLEEREKYLTLLSTPLRITATYFDGSTQYFEFIINDFLYLGEALKIENDVALALKKIESQLRQIEGRLHKIV